MIFKGAVNDPDGTQHEAVTVYIPGSCSAHIKYIKAANKNKTVC